MYRIVCTITDKALVSGSDLPHDHRGAPGRAAEWHDRGWWSKSSGTFWKGEDSVRRHIRNLCCDWQRRWAPALYPRWANEYQTWTEAATAPDWSRLQHLRVEQFFVTDYTITKLSAADFMGMPDERAA